LSGNDRKLRVVVPVVRWVAFLQQVQAVQASNELSLIRPSLSI
jgi:hypothetical protein